MGASWSDEVDQILAGDLAAGFAYLTPAKGVVIAPMAPLGIRDRQAGIVTLSTSLGLWKKLDRIRRNPGVAIVYHAREHGLTNRPGFVVVQGTASFDPVPDRDWLESITPAWDRFLVPRRRSLDRLLDVYYWQRVAINIEVERVMAYPDTEATEDREVFGAAPAAPPPPQDAPRGGTEPRVDPGKVSRHIDRLPHTLLGWCGSDQRPEVVPVGLAETDSEGVRLRVSPGAVPPGSRRAGLTSHQFAPRMVGQEQRIHTGWLRSDGAGSVSYSPHTQAGYRLPPSKFAYYVGCATLATRMRAARKAGIVQ